MTSNVLTTEELVQLKGYRRPGEQQAEAPDLLRCYGCISLNATGQSERAQIANQKGATL